MHNFCELLFRVACLFLILSINNVYASPVVKPDLLLAKTYHENIKLSEYWVSEKYDGVRAYWNGKQLITRGGNIINAPEWFSKGFPSIPLDGELWIGRQQFEKVSGIVRRNEPEDDQWLDIKYMVFDTPIKNLSFNARLDTLKQVIKESNLRHLVLVEQLKVKNHEALNDKLQLLVNLGAEGLMLHKGTSLYRSGRSEELLKLKTYEDAEAIVIAHIPGKGKFSGMMGALLVENESGLRFKIGTGFKNKDRKSPPPVGSTITYKYYGKTNTGKPRFASFLRERPLHGY